jgi:hypothetical protein
MQGKIAASQEVAILKRFKRQAFLKVFQRLLNRFHFTQRYVDKREKIFKTQNNLNSFLSCHDFTVFQNHPGFKLILIKRKYKRVKNAGLWRFAIPSSHFERFLKPLNLRFKVF